MKLMLKFLRNINRSVTYENMAHGIAGYSRTRMSGYYYLHIKLNWE